MTIYQIIDAFTYYGVDVILLAAVTSVLVQICKLTFLKNVQKKLITFLPFIIGTVLYAAYAAIRNLDFLYIFTEYVSVLEHGLSVGAAATLLYVMYEQFVRDAGTDADFGAYDAAVAELIVGFVPEEAVAETAAKLADAVAEALSCGGNGAVAAAEILKDIAAEGVTELDISLLSKLIAAVIGNMSAV